MASIDKKGKKGYYIYGIYYEFERKNQTSFNKIERKKIVEKMEELDKRKTSAKLFVAKNSSSFPPRPVAIK